MDEVPGTHKHTPCTHGCMQTRSPPQGTVTVLPPSIPLPFSRALSSGFYTGGARTFHQLSPRIAVTLSSRRRASDPDLSITPTTTTSVSLSDQSGSILSILFEWLGKGPPPFPSGLTLRCRGWNHCHHFDSKREGLKMPRDTSEPKMQPKWKEGKPHPVIAWKLWI